MEIVEAYSNLREMTPKVLLDLTQSLKYQHVTQMTKSVASTLFR